MRFILTWLLAGSIAMAEVESGVRPGEPLPGDVRDRVDRAVQSLREAMNRSDEKLVREAAAGLRESLGPYAGVPERAPRFIYRPDSEARKPLTCGQMKEIWDRAWQREEDSYEGRGRWGAWAMHPDDPHQLLRRDAYVIMGALAALEVGIGDRDLLEQRVEEGLTYLCSVQRSDGLFPFPDIRETSSHFGPPLQGLYNQHPEAFVDGWVVEDYGDGGLQFDNGVCAVTMLRAYEQTGDGRWLSSAERACDWILTRPVVPNWNYNAFSVWALATYVRMTGDGAYLEPAVAKCRLGVLPGQLETGRWMDPHNARTVYHAISLRAMAALYEVLPLDHGFRNDLLDAIRRADKVLVDEICERGPTDSDHSLSALRAVRNAIGRDDRRAEAINILIRAMYAQVAGPGDKVMDDLTMFGVAEGVTSACTPPHLQRHKLRDLVLEPRTDDASLFDSDRVECPMVVRWKGMWLMFYTGIKLTDGQVDSTIGVAESDDLVHWRDRRQALARGPEGAFDHGGLSGPFVWAEGDELKMIYIGFPRLGYESRPGRHGLATSKNGVDWIKDPANPVHDVGSEGSWNDAVVFKTFVMRHGGEYWMFYNAYGTADHCEQIGLATSKDLYHWREQPANPLLKKGDPQVDRDHRIIGDPWIMKHGHLWEMYYFGFDGQHAREHLATSHDLIHWRKSHRNPIMDIGPPGSYDDIHCHKPCIIEHEGTLYHFFTAVGTKGEREHYRAIGLATSGRLPGMTYRDQR